jgi:transposase
VVVLDKNQKRTNREGAGGSGARDAGEDPFSGTIYVFHLKRADRVKMVVWDSTGLVLLWALKWPPITDGVMRLTSAQLAALVDVIPGKVGH